MTSNLPKLEPYTPGWKPPRFTLGVVMLYVTLFCVGLGILSLLGEANRRRNRLRHRSDCENNLKQIGIALHTYHDIFDCFPPAVLADKSGKPLHSWRVLIWPQCESQHYYDQYIMSEPWNGPTNSKLHWVVPPYWRCPEDDSSPLDTTNYVAITGPGTGWPAPNKSSRISDFKDGLANSIMVVEIRNSDIHWMEPRDLDIRTLKFAVNSDGKNSISSRHIGGGMMLRGDGAVDFLSEQETEARLRAMLLIADEAPADHPKTEAK